MANTTNYNLPLLEQTAAFDLVTDYNSLSNSVDNALKGQVDLLNTSISQLNTDITGADGDISALQQSLATVNTSIQQINSDIASLHQALNGIFDFTETRYISANTLSVYGDANLSGTVHVYVNSTKTLFKVGYDIGITNPKTTNGIQRTAVPGATGNVYGVKITNDSPLGNTPYMYYPVNGHVDLWTVYRNYSESKGYTSNNSTMQGGFSVGTDGNIYICTDSTNTPLVAVVSPWEGCTFRRLTAPQLLYTLQDLNLPVDPDINPSDA